MSLDLMTLAWRTELQAGPRLVLLALCDNANDDGNCRPSINTLSLKCGLSVRAVRTHVSALAADGLLLRHERQGHSTEYQIDFPSLRFAVYKSLSVRKWLSEFDKGVLKACTPDVDTSANPAPRQILPTASTPADSADHPGNNCLPPRQYLPTTPADSAARTIREPSSNRNLKKTKATPSSFSPPDWINRSHWDAWHSCEKRRRATDAQKQLAVEKLAKWRDQGIDYAKALEDAAIGGWQGLFEPKAPAAMTPNRRTSENFEARDYGAGVEIL